MSASHFFTLLLLGAIWGSSFLFMRVSVGALGPVVLIAARVFLGALFMWAVCAWKRYPLNIRQNWRHYFLLGVFNTALPFFLFGFAAQTAPASVMSIINATAPMWAALIGAVWTRKLPSAKVGAGLALGVGGVALLVGYDGHALSGSLVLAMCAGLGAAFCYGLAAVYTQVQKTRGATEVDPLSNAHGSLWAATLCLAPFVPFAPVQTAPDWIVVGSVLALGLVCSGLAYMLYFGLLAKIGAAQTMTVAYLIPVFGVMWGVLILHEPVGLHTIGGAMLVLVAIALITSFNPLKMLERRENAGNA